MEIRLTSQFKKDIKKLKSSSKGKTVEDILKTQIFPTLLSGKVLPEKFKDHALIGDWVVSRECHIYPDTLLIYRIEFDTLILVRLGSHSALFG
ncbi:MAG: mRNA interferase YafQ [Gammaproteobacteria bacterium]|jgi:mRNA interferase YafQ